MHTAHAARFRAMSACAVAPESSRRNERWLSPALRLTAAHRTFPFGTRLVVINPQSGKSVTVTINDRGPFVRGVTLDLSVGAAKMIGMRGTGAVCMARVGRAG
jgi:rare lipoprotein A